MKLLIVSATEGEIIPLLQYLANGSTTQLVTGSMPRFIKDNIEISVCVAGVGMVATTYALTKALSQPYDLVLQAGIGGSFDKNTALGEVVFITSEQYGDLGAEDRETYLDIFEMNLLAPDIYPFAGTKLQTPLLPVHEKIRLRQAKGLTVNTVSGNGPTIKLRNERYGCDVESMEGAAFHYVCLQEKVPFAQVRGISNYVAPRDKSTWRMRDAVINLNNWLIDFIETL
jgi:futalosine hydrolase